MRKAAVILFTLCGITSQVFAKEPLVKFYNEIAAPFYWLDDDGNPKGASFELASALIAETKLNATIEHLPWARAFHYAVNDKNVVLTSALRTEEREQQLQWLGQVLIVRASLFQLSDRDPFLINSLEQAKKLSVGSIRGYGSANYLIGQGFSEKKNLILAANSEQLWSLLYKNRIDLVLSNQVTGRYEISAIGLDPNKLSEVYEIADLNLELQIATGNKTSPALAKRLSDGLIALKQNGEYQRIMERWGLL